MGDGQRHIVLVGMMGSGKSTIGNLVATRLHRHFLDIDDEIEAEHDKSVTELFERRGEAEFREIEADSVQRVLAGRTPLVIATGGGAVLDPESRAVMKSETTCVWLQCDPAVLGARLVDEASHRPLLAEASGVTDVEELLRTLAERRAGAYAEAAGGPFGVAVDVSDLDPPAAADAVVAAIRALPTDSSVQIGRG